MEDYLRISGGSDAAAAAASPNDVQVYRQAAAAAAACALGRAFVRARGATSFVFVSSGGIWPQRVRLVFVGSGGVRTTMHWGFVFHERWRRLCFHRYVEACECMVAKRTGAEGRLVVFLAALFLSPHFQWYERWRCFMLNVSACLHFTPWEGAPGQRARAERGGVLVTPPLVSLPRKQ